MEQLFDKIFGFLPERSMIWTGILYLTSMFLIRYINGKVMKIIELPWMKECNQKLRKQFETNQK